MIVSLVYLTAADFLKGLLPRTRVLVEVLIRARSEVGVCYVEYYVLVSARQGDQLHFVVYYFGSAEWGSEELLENSRILCERFLETEVAQSRGLYFDRDWQLFPYAVDLDEMLKKVTAEKVEDFGYVE